MVYIAELLEKEIVVCVMYLAELLEKEKVVCVVYIGELASKGKSCHNRKFANNG